MGEETNGAEKSYNVALIQAMKDYQAVMTWWETHKSTNPQASLIENEVLKAAREAFWIASDIAEEIFEANAF